MAIHILPLGNGQLGTTEGDVYTVPANKRAIVKGIRIVNTDTQARTFNLFYKANGGTSRRIIPVDLSLAAGGAFIDDSEITMTDGDKIRGYASVATKVDFVVSGLERDAV